MPKLLRFINRVIPIGELTVGRVVRLNILDSDKVMTPTQFYGHVVGFYIEEQDDSYEVLLRVDFNGVTKPFKTGCLELL